MNMNDMKFTTAGDYMADINKDKERFEKVMKSDPYEVNKPTGGETWQTKANAKNTVPRYYSPTELLSMRVDKLEDMVRTLHVGMENLNERLSNISSEMFQPITDDEIYSKPKGER